MALLKPRDPALNGRPRQRAIANIRATHPPYCWLCGLPIDMQADRQRHPLASSIDEIIPRSLGGSALDPSNLRHAHRLCNSVRQNKPVTEGLRRACRAAVIRTANKITIRHW